jgi:hypothetical protein
LAYYLIVTGLFIVSVIGGDIGGIWTGVALRGFFVFFVYLGLIATKYCKGFE